MKGRLLPKHLVQRFKNLIPYNRTNQADLRKGDHGKVLVIGGSPQYSGAPYFAAISTMKAGGDLAYVLCDQSAEASIKSYSPELIVFGYLNAVNELDKIQQVSSLILSRRLSVVIGCGLGRELSSMNVILQKIIAPITTSNAKYSIVFDADALFFLSSTSRSLFQGIVTNPLTVLTLTPNPVEYSRLLQAFQPLDQISRSNFVPMNPDVSHELTDDVLETASLALAMARWMTHSTCTSLPIFSIVKKGRRDVIVTVFQEATNVKVAYFVSPHDPSSIRRCGGQGDVLAGVVGLFMDWILSSQEGGQDGTDVSTALIAASFCVRYASMLAFEEHGVSTTTVDILSKLGKTVDLFIQPKFGLGATPDLFL
jgi:ATP-dependent NAD(P)H-hydrate dehydratase